MKISIIAIGDELLIGQVVDTNSGMIARTINPDGWTVGSVRVVADDAAEIKRAVEAAFAESRVVLTTGGLGPTKDDITKQTLLELFGGEMVHDEATERNVMEVVGKRGLKINPLTAAQADVPSSCRVIQNKVGTAPIMWFEKDGKVLVSMPGVPFETEEMLRTEVFPQLKSRFRSDEEVVHQTLVVAGYSESALAGKLAPFEEALPAGVHLAYLPKPGLIRLRLTGRSAIADAARLRSTLRALTGELRAALGNDLIAEADMTPAEILGQTLRERGLTVATAESCTGGSVARELTQVAGSSDYYAGSVVAYSNAVKAKLLGVDAATIEREGAVSETVARQMAEGAARRLSTDCAIATTGIAGPGGGTPGKPVGTVWIAATLQGRTVAALHHFAGNRGRVVNHATTMAQLALIRLLQAQPTASARK